MNALRKEIEKRIERVVDVWSKDVADDNDRHESGRLEDEFRAFMDGVVAAAAVAPTRRRTCGGSRRRGMPGTWNSASPDAWKS